MRIELENYTCLRCDLSSVFDNDIDIAKCIYIAKCVYIAITHILSLHVGFCVFS